MTNRTLLAAALLASLAGSARAECPGGVCPVNGGVPRQLGGTAWTQAQAGFPTADPGGPSGPTSTPRAMPPPTPSGATEQSGITSGGPAGPAAEVPPPAGCGSCGGKKAAAAGGRAAAAKGGGGGCKSCKVKQGGIAGFFSSLFSALFG